jgi:hypothetical protein
MYLFDCYLSKKLVLRMYNFVVVLVCFRFCESIFVCKLLKLYLNYTELDVL